MSGTNQDSMSRREFLYKGLAGAVLVGTGTLYLLAKPACAAAAKSVDKVTFRVLDGQACLGCKALMQDLVPALKKECSKYFPQGSEVCLAIGRQNKDVPERTIAIGKCSANLQEQAPLFVPGCVPRQEDIFKAIQNGFKNQGKTAEAKKRYAQLFLTEKKTTATKKKTGSS